MNAADDYQFRINLRLATYKGIDQHVDRLVGLRQRTYENNAWLTILPWPARTRCESAFWQFDVRIVRDTNSP